MSDVFLAASDGGSCATFRPAVYFCFRISLFHAQICESLLTVLEPCADCWK